MKKITIVLLLFIFVALPITYATGEFAYNRLDSTPRQVYGEMWGMDIGDVDILSSDVYFNVTNLTEGLNKNVIFFNDSLIIQIPGVYKVSSQWSFRDGANTEFHLSLAIDDVQNDKCHAERKIGTGGDVGSASYTCLLNLSKTNVITVVIENVGNTNNPAIDNIQFNIIRID